MRGRVDNTQKEIVAALEKIGAVVTDLSQVGNDVPDLLVSFRNKWHLIEVVGDAKFKRYKKTGGLSPGQAEWSKKQNAEVIIARDSGDAIDGLMKVAPI